MLLTVGKLKLFMYSYPKKYILFIYFTLLISIIKDIFNKIKTQFPLNSNIKSFNKFKRISLFILVILKLGLI